jgi:photosystem II stability/assembly factor-like uncharacterized protein
MGTEGTILKTIDGGKNWNSRTIGANNSLSDLFFTDSITGWAVGRDGIILKTKLLMEE